MLFPERVAIKPLAELLRRLSLSLEAGIDIRRTLESESRRNSPALRDRLTDISGAVNAGTSFSEAMRATGDYFPALVRELVEVGEQTGHLPEALRQLAVHYDQQLELRRDFMSAVRWPLMQLGISLAVVGLLIWVNGIIRNITGEPVDILGLGLSGERGLAIYMFVLTMIAVAAFLLYRAILTGKLWAAKVQKTALRIPAIGSALRTMAVGRFAWTLQITSATALDVKRSLSLALASTHIEEFTSQRRRMLEVIQRGEPIYVALEQSGVFPTEFIHAVEVGEETGRLAESLAVQSRHYLDEARRALARLAMFAGYAVWFLVAAFIVMLIFRIYGTYVGNINDALRDLNHR